MKITKANGKAEYALIENLKKRAGETDPKIVEIVTNIINAVKEQGDDAVREFTVRFDGSVPKRTVIEKEELNSYLDIVDDDFKQALYNAKENIYNFHLRLSELLIRYNIRAEIALKWNGISVFTIFPAYNIIVGMTRYQ